MSKIKKFMSALTALTLTTISAVSMVASANDNSYLYWSSETRDVGYYTVVFWSNSMTGEEYCNIATCNDNTLTEVIIPDEINGVPVKSLGSNVFGNFDNLTSVEFGNKYKRLNSMLFADCDALTEITLPEWVTTVENSMFDSCSNLKKVVLTCDDVPYIGDCAFFNCTSLETVVLPSGGNSNVIDDAIGSYAFYNCDSLESIALSRYYTDYTRYQFADCDNLKTVSFTSPRYALELDETFFSNCPNLTSVTDRDGVELEFSTEYVELPSYIPCYDTYLASKEVENTTEVESTILEGLQPTLIGDANCDGIVTVSDALVLAEYVAKDGNLDLTEQAMVNADVHETGNGLNASDAYMIQQYATGVIESL